MIGTGRLGDKCTGRYLAVVNYTLNGGITRYDVAENTRGKIRRSILPGTNLKNPASVGYRSPAARFSSFSFPVYNATCHRV